MAEKLRTVEVENEKIESSEATTAQPSLVPLDQVVSRICRDSQNDSSEYLEDTVVPKGGE